MVASFGGDLVPCARYEPFGSDALAMAVVEALADRYRACLMASHGMIALGATLPQAADLTVKLETLARQYILARQAGEPVLLTPAELAEVHRRYPYYGKSRLPR
jgi:L-fuculose-phosphate aldolase